MSTNGNSSGPGAIAHAIMRIGAGVLFCIHGMPKVFGWFGGMGDEGQAAELFSRIGLAGVLEVFGGLFIALGLLTRPVAFVLALEMVAAYYLAHMPQGWNPYLNGGELALLYMFVWIFLAANGSGPASIDRMIRNRSKEA